MDLMNGKVRLFCVSNIIVSFMCTSFLGVKYSYSLETLDDNSTEQIIAASDTEPASRLGDKVEKNTEVKVENKKNTSKTSKKTTITKVVKKREVAKTVSYAPAKYSSVTGNAVVEYAKKFLGLRYSSSGFSLRTGTDCSGFTKLIYKEFGVSLSRSAKGQASNGTYVKKSDLEKGDLVFYGQKSGSISHVGIYMGNGRVIHESNHKDGVKISSVNMMHYITARRVINTKAIKIAEQKQAESNTTKETNSVVNNTTVKNNDNNVPNVVDDKPTTTNTSTTTSASNAVVEKKVEVKEESKKKKKKQDTTTKESSTSENQS